MNVGSQPQDARKSTAAKLRPPAPTSWANPDTTLANTVASESANFADPRAPNDAAPKASVAPISAGLSAEIDDAFEGMLDGSIEAVDVGADDGHMRDLFAQIAAQYMRPVRDFVIELQWAEPSRDWLGICAPAVLSLRQSAEPIDARPLCDALDAFLVALGEADRSREPTVAGDHKTRILAAFAKLGELMPQAFNLGDERDRRESVIVHSLLRQIPDVGKVTFDKLFGAGLGALDMMLLAKASDIVEATGIDPKLAEKIVARFTTYKRELESAKHDESRSGEHAKLAQLTEALREASFHYDALDGAVDDDAVKQRKALRNARQARLSEIQVLLARLGEVDLVRAIEPLPFARKLDELDRFIAKANEKK